MGSSQKPEDLTTEELFRRFAPFVARFLFRLGVRSDGLDDVVQEVFLVVHRRGGYRAGPAKPTSYLATIATNAASAYRRRQRVEQARRSDAEVDGLVSTSKGPVQVLEVSERLELLQAALERLEPDFRSTLILADLEGESCASIAASSGVPTGTVYWRLHEARKRFRRALRATMAGVPPRRAIAEHEQTAGAASRERGAVLLFAASPLWFVSGARRLLRASVTEVPVHYDVTRGLEKHRQLAGTAPAPSWAPPAIVAGPAATSLGVLGASGAGTVTVVALVAGLWIHAKARTPLEDRAVTASSATVSVAPAPSVRPAVTGSAPSNDPSPRGVGEPGKEAPPGSTAAPIPFENLPPAGSANPATPVVTSDRTLGRGTAIAPPAGSSAPTDRTKAAPVTNNATRVVRAPEPAPSDAPEPAPSNSPIEAPIEAKEIARAERLLASNPAGALSIVRDARARFKPSFLPEERDYVEVMALQALGRSADAKAAASRFLNVYPDGAFGNRMRQIAGR